MSVVSWLVAWNLAVWFGCKASYALLAFNCRLDIRCLVELVTFAALLLQGLPKSGADPPQARTCCCILTTNRWLTSCRESVMGDSSALRRVKEALIRVLFFRKSNTASCLGSSSFLCARCGMAELGKKHSSCFSVVWKIEFYDPKN